MNGTSWALHAVAGVLVIGAAVYCIVTGDTGVLPLLGLVGALLVASAVQEWRERDQ